MEWIAQNVRTVLMGQDEKLIVEWLIDKGGTKLMSQSEIKLVQAGHRYTIRSLDRQALDHNPSWKRKRGKPFADYR